MTYIYDKAQARRDWQAGRRTSPAELQVAIERAQSAQSRSLTAYDATAIERAYRERVSAQLRRDTEEGFAEIRRRHDLPEPETEKHDDSQSRDDRTIVLEPYKPGEPGYRTTDDATLLAYRRKLYELYGQKYDGG